MKDAHEQGPQLNDLITRLGYLQGDVAATIRSPLTRLKRRVRGASSVELINEALAAVHTLEHEGQ